MMRNARYLARRHVHACVTVCTCGQSGIRDTVRRAGIPDALRRAGIPDALRRAGILDALRRAGIIDAETRGMTRNAQMMTWIFWDGPTRGVGGLVSNMSHKFWREVPAEFSMCHQKAAVALCWNLQAPYMRTATQEQEVHV